jgi:putative PIN family toxin of toxin-antitoxin system
LRFILDTNVVMSAMVSRVATAPPRRLLEALADAHFESVVSPALALEWREVAGRPQLRRYFRLDAASIHLALARIEQLSDTIDPPPAERVAPDPNDAHLWAILAADPGAILVTGDGPLLDAPFGPDRVITPAQAVERLDRTRGGGGA